MAPARHFDRRLVGLGARIGEENKVGEGRLGEALGIALAFGVLIEVRNVPELRALIRQRFDEMRMGVADRGHGDAGAEVEIALSGGRNEPAALASLESDLGPGVGRNHSGSRVGDTHRQLLVMSRETGLPRSACSRPKKNPRPARAAAKFAFTITESARCGQIARWSALLPAAALRLFRPGSPTPVGASPRAQDRRGRVAASPRSRVLERQGGAGRGGWL